jgi:hypothetical protein
MMCAALSAPSPRPPTTPPPPQLDLTLTLTVTLSHGSRAADSARDRDSRSPAKSAEFRGP